MPDSTGSNGSASIAAMAPAEKRELLARLLREKARSARSYPMSFAQERLWFLDQFDPGPVYNIPMQVRFPGPLDEPALRKTIGELVRRHEVLRTTFHTENGRPVQRVHPATAPALPVVDLRAAPAETRESEAAAVAAREAAVRLDLAQGPLFRATLVRVHDDDSVLVLVMHHIVSDGWSVGVLMRELGALYDAYANGRASPLPELPLQYADFAAQQREFLSGDVLERQLGYWREQLRGAPELLNLLVDRPRPKAQTFNGAWQPFTVAPAVTAGLQRICRTERVTTFMTLLAAFGILLYRYTDQGDVVVGTPIANRNRAEIEALVGFFVNTLAIRTRLAGTDTVLDVIRRVRETTLQAYDHQDLPFEKLVVELQPDRDLSHSPLFQVMFALQNTPGASPGEGVPQAYADDPQPPPVYLGTAKFDLTLSMTETGDRLAGTIEYNTDLFEHATVARMIGHFRTLLAAIAEQPERLVGELPLVTPAERRAILVVNQTAVPIPALRALHELFDAQADRTPNAVAVVFGGERLTYRELDRRANRLAHLLVRLGAGPGVRVALCVERSLELVVGILGILKAGAAYVPLEPAHPPDRLRFLIEDARCPLVVTLERFTAVLPRDGARLVVLDAGAAEIAAEDDRRPPVRTTLDDVVTLFYTSGSTGRPKGNLSHGRGLVNLMQWYRGAAAIDAHTRLLLMTPFTFDASFKNIIAPISYGGTLILADDFSQDLQLLLDTIERTRATTTFTTPSLLYAIVALAREDGYRQLSSLRKLFIGGEPTDLRKLREWFASPACACRLYHNYGPSECADATTIYVPSREQLLACEPMPIGKPIDNMTVYVVNDALELQPDGIAGELCIGGVGVAWGYLDRPALTAEKFVPNPYEPGRRFYRTGDRVRRRPSGDLDFIGRLDNQVKLRGIRIELEEIDAVLSGHAGLRGAVVALREDASGDKRLIAYVVVADGAPLDVGALRTFLKERLPNYMIPAAFVEVGALPISPNGKVDRRALPSPDAPVPEGSYRAPRNAVEAVLAGFWSEVLSVPQVGVDDNFFDLGGHSLLATQVMSRVRDAFAVELPLRRIFEAPTVAELAAAMLADAQIGQRVERRAPVLLRVASMSDDEVESALGATAREPRP
jgi:amino acid adenylation domain-containing protein